MSRALWFAAGGIAGMYTLVKARRTAHAFTPDGLGARLAALRAGASVFADQVVEGMTEREEQLRAQLELSGANRLLLEERPGRETPSETNAPSTTSSSPLGGGYGHR